jgi:hypothetical protein
MLAKKLIKNTNPISLITISLELNFTKERIATNAERAVWI